MPEGRSGRTTSRLRRRRRRPGHATVATVVLLAALTGYVRRLQRRHPIPDAEQAWILGLSWVVVTLGFEFGFGRLVAGLTWSELLADYDVPAGRIWVLVPLWTATAPEVMRRLTSPRATPATAA